MPRIGNIKGLVKGIAIMGRSPYLWPFRVHNNTSCSLTQRLELCIPSTAQALNQLLPNMMTQIVFGR
jgi:hypothetical protein